MNRLLDEPISTRPERIPAPEPAAMRRMRFWSRLLDTSIVLPGGYRIGIDPIVGLLPGAGDFIASLLSCYIVVEAYRLGIPLRVIGVMLINIVAEGLVGTIPVVGDIFDVVWKANIRNFRLVESSYSPALKPRSALKFVLILVVAITAFLLLTAAAIIFLIKTILSAVL